MAEIKTERLGGYRRLIEIARDLASTLDLDVLLERIVQVGGHLEIKLLRHIIIQQD